MRDGANERSRGDRGPRSTWVPFVSRGWFTAHGYIYTHPFVNVYICVTSKAQRTRRTCVHCIPRSCHDTATIYTYVYIFICIYVYLYMYICIFIRVYSYIYICIYTHPYTCKYTYVYTWNPSSLRRLQLYTWLKINIAIQYEHRWDLCLPSRIFVRNPPWNRDTGG